MFAPKTQDQGTITLSQQDYLPILVDSFLVDRRSQGLSAETISLYRKKLAYFLRFCEVQAVSQVAQVTPDLIRRFLLYLGLGESRRLGKHETLMVQVCDRVVTCICAGGWFSTGSSFPPSRCIPGKRQPAPFASRHRG